MSVTQALSRAPGHGHVPPLTDIPTHRHSGTRTGGDLEEEAERLARTWTGPLDTEAVRVHHGPESAALTAAHGADAVTIGRDIHLAPDHPSLASPEGRLLLAHELVHVWQQTSGRAAYGLQQSRRTKKVKHARRFKILVDREMGPEDLLREFVTQYYRLSRPQDVERVLARWHWTPRPRSAKAADAQKQHVWVNVYNDPADRDVAALSKEDRDAVNAETDRRFAEQTGLGADFRLGQTPEDAELRARWRGVRANLVAEHEQARALRALPADIQKIMFAGGRAIAPDEYGVALQLAERIGKLSAADRAQYLARVNASTTDLAELEQSVARFERHLQFRKWDEEAFDDASAQLFGAGLEELYGLWKAKQRAETMTVTGPLIEGAATALTITAGGRVPDLGHYERERDEADRRFREALARSRFRTEADFVAALNGFRSRFRTQTVNLAMDVLAGFDHLLYVAKLKFRDTDAAERLVGDIAAFDAASDYDAAAEARARAYRSLGPGLLTPLTTLNPGSPIALLAEAAEFRAAGSAKVVEASGSEPIIDPTMLGKKTDREYLARANAEQVREHLFEVIQKRLEDSATVRGELTEDPERVFSQPLLVQAALQQNGIEPDSIYGQIVLDHMEDVRNAHLFSSIVIGLIGLILAALVPVGGWVAAAALVAGAGISTWQAVDAIVEYNKGQSEYALGFISDEPSLFWVGVAVVGAAFELGMTAAQLFKAAAPALIKLKTPLTEFVEAAEAEKVAKLRTLTEQIDAVEGLQEELRVALKAQAAAELAFTQALTGGSKLRASVTGLEPVFEAIYYAVKRGVTRVTALRKEKELIAAFGKLTKLEGAPMQELTIAYRRVREAVKVGGEVGMDEATLLKYVDRLADEHAAGEAAFKAVTKEMRAWRPPTLEQVQAEARLTAAHDQLTSLHGLKFELEAERAAMASGKLPASQARQVEISQELQELTGVSERTGAALPGGGLLKKASRDFNEAMRFAEQAGLDPKVLMRRAFNASTERRAVVDAAQGLDRVGGLLRSSGEIEVDHIVSMQRMTEMEGFNKLRPAERRVLAIRSDNLIAMDAVANRSKWHYSWSMWPDAGRFYPESTIAAMKAADATLTARIEEWIRLTVKNR